MTGEQQHVLAFHQKMGLEVNWHPSFPEKETQILRERLIDEEAEETCLAIREGDLVGIADGLADLLYVTLGAAVAYGIDLEPVFREVHRTNMLKVGGGRGAYGKILKPDSWEPPKIREELIKQGATL